MDTLLRKISQPRKFSLALGLCITASLLWIPASPAGAQAGERNEADIKFRRADTDSQSANKTDAKPERKEVDLKFQRKDSRKAAPKGTYKRPQRRALPKDLAMRAEPKKSTARRRPTGQAAPRPDDRRKDDRRKDERVDSRRRGDASVRPARHYDRLERRAEDAAAKTAAYMVDRYGRASYYKVGLYRGVKAAFDRISHDSWDYRQGVRSGNRDRDAESLGFDYGSRDGELQARTDAERSVDEQFRDLRNDPRPSPRAQAPRYRFDLSSLRIREPRLEDVFRELSFPRGRHRYLKTALDPWGLYNSSSYREVYGRDWRDARKAFEHWLRNERSRYYRELDRRDREYFKSVFYGEYAYHLHRRLAPVADRAYEHGYDDGWDYGRRAAGEWQYRRGYHRGYIEQVVNSAGRAFSRTYERAYESYYRDSFDDWSGSIKAEILDIRLEDADGDGVFQPGEEILVDLEIANFGGRGGEVPLSLRGRHLTERDSRSVRLRPRTQRRLRRPMTVRIDPNTPPRTESEVLAAFGDGHLREPFRITFPLELDRHVRLIAHDSLAGVATLEVGLRNLSRRPVSAAVDVETGQRPFVDDRRQTLGPRDSRKVRVELRRLDSLDLLAGDLPISIVARSRNAVHDRFEHRLPALGLDLANRDLVELMLEMARGDRRAGRNDIDRAQKLMLERLRRDWHRATERGGNPYKEDLRQGSRITALGDLVASVAGEARYFRYPEVFRGLPRNIEGLAKSLPGAHPFLRGSMKKLARKLRTR